MRAPWHGGWGQTWGPGACRGNARQIVWGPREDATVEFAFLNVTMASLWETGWAALRRCQHWVEAVTWCGRERLVWTKGGDGAEEARGHLRVGWGLARESGVADR